VHLGIRPEHLEVVSLEEADLKFQTTVLEKLGDHSLLYGHVGQSKCTLRIGPNAQYNSGDLLGLRLHPEHYHVFGPRENNVTLWP
jgi:sn-glycerol 3-phosphate transport system ATP-binding protein